MRNTLKAQARAARREAARARRNANRTRISIQRRCFWSWPLGHEWVNFGDLEHPSHRCICCDTPRTTQDAINAQLHRFPDRLPEH